MQTVHCKRADSTHFCHSLPRQHTVAHSLPKVDGLGSVSNTGKFSSASQLTVLNAGQIPSNPGGISGKNTFPGGKSRKKGGGGGVVRNNSPGGKSENSCFQDEKVCVGGTYVTRA